MMPLRLDRLLATVRTVEIPFDDGALTVTYRAGRINSALAAAPTVDGLVQIIESWDLVVDEGGAPYPVDQASIARLPDAVVVRIAQAIYADSMSPASSRAGD